MKLADWDIVDGSLMQVRKIIIFPNTFCFRTNVFSIIMATSIAITCITGPPRILTGCSKRIRKSDGRWTFERVFLETTSLGHIFLMVRSMAKNTENFLKTILPPCWKRCHWNHVLICGSSRTAILHTPPRRQECYWIRNSVIIGLVFVVLTNGHHVHQTLHH